MNMIYKDMQEEQRTKGGRLISGREKIKATETLKNKVVRFLEIQLKCLDPLFIIN